MAVAWGCSVSMYDVPIPSPQPARPPEASGESPASSAMAECSQIRQWEEARLVQGLHWLDGPALAVLTDAGPHTLMRLYDPGAAPACLSAILFPSSQRIVQRSKPKILLTVTSALGWPFTDREDMGTRAAHVIISKCTF